MKSLSSFVATMFVSFSHAQLTTSVSQKENTTVGMHADSCSQSVVLNYYFQNILLNSPQNIGSIFILTDCLTDFNSLYNIQLLAHHTPIAIVSVSMFSSVVDASIFNGETKSLILLDLSEEYIEFVMKEVYVKCRNAEHCVLKWQPTIFIFWKSLTKENEQFNIINNSLSTSTIYFDSTIFVYFFESGTTPSPLKISVWEAYSIKQKRVYGIVKSFYANELVIISDDAKSGKSKAQLSTLQEELESFAKRRRNFHLESLVASVKFDPNYYDWVRLTEMDKDVYEIAGGYVAMLYWDLKCLMNFSEYILLGDSPKPLPNGTLGGITVKQLLSDKIDLTLNQISYSEQRAKVLTFLQPTYVSLTYVFFKQPSSSSVQDIVVMAFQKELWITLIGVWATLVISIKVRLALLSKNNNFFSFYHPLRKRTDRKFVEESVLWSVAAFCQKTWYLDPHSTSLRMKVMIGSLVGFLTYTAYSGSIVSSLAINKIPVKNFHDLINFNFIFTVHEQSEPFQTMLKGMIKAYSLNQEIKTASTVTEVSHLFVGSSRSTLRSSKAAFLSPADMFYKTAESQNHTNSFICDHVSSLSTGTYTSKSAMLVKKESQFKEVLNYMLAYIRGRGFIYRNIDRYNTQNFIKCIPKDQQESIIEPASWIDVFTIELILFIGFLLSILFLFLEMLYVWYNERRSISDFQAIMLHELYDARNHFSLWDSLIDTYYIA